MRQKMILLSVIGIMLLLNGCGNFHLRGTVPNYEEETYTASSKIKNVVLQDDDISVQICQSNSDKLRLSYYSADDGSEQYKIKEDKGKMDIAKESEPNYGIFVFGDRYSSDSFKNVKLTLYLPHNYEGDLSIQTLDGDIIIGDVAIENLTINTNDGDVSFDNTAISQSLCCKTKDGNITGELSGKISEYPHEMKTISGTNNLVSNIDGNKAIEVTTKDGDLDISFNKDNR